MKRRILWITFAITVLSIVVIVLLCNTVYYNKTVNDTRKYLETYMNYYDKSQGFSQQYATELSQKLNGARVTFIASDGMVVADSHNTSIVDTTHIDRQEVYDAMKSGEGFAVRKSDTVNADMAYYCLRQQGRQSCQNFTAAGQFV